MRKAGPGHGSWVAYDVFPTAGSQPPDIERFLTPTLQFCSKVSPDFTIISFAADTKQLHVSLCAVYVIQSD